MADGISVQLLGADRFAATTERAARDISTFDAASRSAAQQVAGQARSRAPRLTGRLAASITGKPDGHGGFEVAVQLGLVYPIVQEYGSRYVRGRHFMRATIDGSEAVITRTYEADLQRIVGTIRGT
jgi:HK97 gp10 family phage protein